MTKKKAKPLEGIRVLDVGVIAVGPFAATMLGYLGADVIRIENREGDYVQRQYPLMKGMGYAYITCNCNKRNIMLDLRLDSDREIALKLVGKADVFICNSKTGVMDKIGMGYKDLFKINPKLIYCSCPGYGNKGPYKARGAADPYIQAFSAFASLNGEPGTHGELFRVYGFLDQVASLMICQSIMIALYYRELTGQGQKIETSLLEASIALQATKISEFLITGKSPMTIGSSSSRIAPSQSFRTLDGKFINVSVPDDETWSRFCKALNISELENDSRFCNNYKRLKNRDQLSTILEKIFEDQPARWWILSLNRQKIPCGPINTYDEVSTDPHFLKTRMVIDLVTPWGMVKLGGIPWEFSEFELSIKKPSLPNQDKEEILKESELSDE